MVTLVTHTAWQLHIGDDSIQYQRAESARRKDCAACERKCVVIDWHHAEDFQHNDTEY